MDMFASPAALGGIIMCTALGAWTLGRWQGGRGPSRDGGDHLADQEAISPPPLADAGEDPAPAIPCQQAAQAERQGALTCAASLGDLHEEVSAYRRAEQVLAGLGRDQLQTLAITGSKQQCRYFGLTGQPTCALPDAARQTCACACDSRFTAPRPLARQPSPAASDFTRV